MKIIKNIIIVSVILLSFSNRINITIVMPATYNLVFSFPQTSRGLRIYFLTNNLRGHSSVGRASALQAEGLRFESACLHQFLLVDHVSLVSSGSVAQLVRAPP